LKGNVPTISTFFGIVIRMYYDDHGPPHFHAYYGEDMALISLETLEVLQGRLPRRAMSLVLARIIHERFYCNRGFAAATRLAACFTAPSGRARRSGGQHPVQGCLPSSRLRAPVSLGDSTISRRTVMNNAG